MDKWRKIMTQFERITQFDGKTISAVAWDGYEEFRIVFTDDTVLIIRERMQGGQLSWDTDPT